jgi:hypothetical protein
MLRSFLSASISGVQEAATTRAAAGRRALPADHRSLRVQGHRSRSGLGVHPGSGVGRRRTGCAGGCRSSGGRRSSLGRPGVQVRRSQLVRRSHQDRGFRSRRAAAAAAAAAEAGHRILPVSHTGPGHAAAAHLHTGLQESRAERRVAAGRRSHRVAERARASHSRAGSGERCYADRQAGMTWEGRCRCMLRRMRRRSGCTRSRRRRKACCAVVNQ